jgi:hypothetical protein
MKVKLHYRELAVIASGLSLLTILSCGRKQEMGLVAHWVMPTQVCDTIMDRSANGLDGEFHSVVFETDSLCPKHSLLRPVFRKESFIKIPESQLLNAGPELTIMFWIEFDSPPDTVFPIYKGVGERFDYAIRIWKTDRSYAAGFHCNSNPVPLCYVELDTLLIGKWCHIAFSFAPGNPSSAVWYIDGYELDRSVYLGPSCYARPIQGRDPLFLTKHSENDTTGSVWKMDDIRIYNRIVHRHEVFKVFQNLQPSFGHVCCEHYTPDTIKGWFKQLRQLRLTHKLLTALLERMEPLTLRMPFPSHYKQYVSPNGLLSLRYPSEWYVCNDAKNLIKKKKGIQEDSYFDSGIKYDAVFFDGKMVVGFTGVYCMDCCSSICDIDSLSDAPNIRKLYDRFSIDGTQISRMRDNDSYSEHATYYDGKRYTSYSLNCSDGIAVLSLFREEATFWPEHLAEMKSLTNSITCDRRDITTCSYSPIPVVSGNTLWRGNRVGFWPGLRDGLLLVTAVKYAWDFAKDNLRLAVWVYRIGFIIGFIVATVLLLYCLVLFSIPFLSWWQ